MSKQKRVIHHLVKEVYFMFLSKALLKSALVLLVIMSVFLVTGCPKLREVPDVIGLTQEEASEALATAWFAVGKTTEEYDDSVIAGTIIGQKPKRLKKVLAGTAVDLVISKSHLPDVIGMVLGNAKAAITDTGFTEGMILQKYSSKPSNQVIGINVRGPAEYTNLNEIVVDLVVSINIPDGELAGPIEDGVGAVIISVEDFAIDRLIIGQILPNIANYYGISVLMGTVIEADGSFNHECYTGRFTGGVDDLAAEGTIYKGSSTFPLYHLEGKEEYDFDTEYEDEKISWTIRNNKGLSTCKYIQELNNDGMELWYTGVMEDDIDLLLNGSICFEFTVETTANICLNVLIPVISPQSAVLCDVVITDIDGQEVKGKELKPGIYYANPKVYFRDNIDLNGTYEFILSLTNFSERH